MNPKSKKYLFNIKRISQIGIEYSTLQIKVCITYISITEVFLDRPALWGVISVNHAKTVGKIENYVLSARDV